MRAVELSIPGNEAVERQADTALAIVNKSERKIRENIWKPSLTEKEKLCLSLSMHDVTENHSR